MYDSLPKACQTLHKLYKFDDGYRQQYGFGLDVVTLNLWSFCEEFTGSGMPLNAGVFATTAYGDILSLLKLDGQFREESPVISTAPSRFWDPSLVAAPNLREFLTVQSYLGFDDCDDSAIGEKAGWWFADRLNQDQRKILSELRKALSLTPIDPTVYTFERNQKVIRDIMPLIENPELPRLTEEQRRFFEGGDPEE